MKEDWPAGPIHKAERGSSGLQLNHTGKQARLKFKVFTHQGVGASAAWFKPAKCDPKLHYFVSILN